MARYVTEACRSERNICLGSAPTHVREHLSHTRATCVCTVVPSKTPSSGKNPLSAAEPAGRWGRNLTTGGHPPGARTEYICANTGSLHFCVSSFSDSKHHHPHAQTLVKQLPFAGVSKRLQAGFRRAREIMISQAGCTTERAASAQCRSTSESN